VPEAQHRLSHAQWQLKDLLASWQRSFSPKLPTWSCSRSWAPGRVGKTAGELERAACVKREACGRLGLYRTKVHSVAAGGTTLRSVTLVCTSKGVNLQLAGAAEGNLASKQHLDLVPWVPSSSQELRVLW